LKYTDPTGHVPQSGAKLGGSESSILNKLQRPETPTFEVPYGYDVVYNPTIALPELVPNTNAPSSGYTPPSNTQQTQQIRDNSTTENKTLPETVTSKSTTTLEDSAQNKTTQSEMTTAIAEAISDKNNSDVGSNPPPSSGSQSTPKKDEPVIINTPERILLFQEVFDIYEILDSANSKNTISRDSNYESYNLVQHFKTPVFNLIQTMIFDTMDDVAWAFGVIFHNLSMKQQQEWLALIDEVFDSRGNLVGYKISKITNSYISHTEKRQKVDYDAIAIDSRDYTRNTVAVIHTHWNTSYNSQNSAFFSGNPEAIANSSTRYVQGKDDFAYTVNDGLTAYLVNPSGDIIKMTPNGGDPKYHYDRVFSYHRGGYEKYRELFSIGNVNDILKTIDNKYGIDTKDIYGTK
jgi:hypothetical protein